jgi:transcriptional regulator with GAF, ATPase, and Fis domain
VTGESGVGNELVAACIHAESRRASRPFVAVNCAGLSETLLESELFGHVKGSFTDAYRDKPGKFEQAHTGTLFLDEMGEMTPRMQGILLRVLETGELQKVGEDRRTTRVDTRVIAATNRDLPDMVRRGRFREDLFYRLNVIHVRVPPLRERIEDIPLLVELFLQRIARESGAEFRCAPGFIQVLQAYRWPGNVRQLENLVQRVAVTSTDGVLMAADLPPEVQSEVPARLPEPRHERRKTVADQLYARLTAGASFWDIVYTPFMSRELTKADLRALIHRGLEASRGSYRGTTRRFNIDPADYKRFLNFLRKQGCLLPFRDYR